MISVTEMWEALKRRGDPRPILVFNGELDRIRSGYYSSFIVPRLNNVKRSFMPQVEGVFYMRNIKRPTGGWCCLHPCSTSAAPLQHPCRTRAAPLQHPCRTRAARLQHPCSTPVAPPQHPCRTPAAPQSASRGAGVRSDKPSV
jgi:hypothetical protein